MKNLRPLLIALALVVVGVVVLLTQKPHGAAISNALVVGTETDVSTLDPTKTLDPHVIRIEGQIYEGLAGLDENNQTIPALAESWTPNATFDRWRFVLRKGVYFHESPIFGASKTREVTADDVAFTFNRDVAKDSMISFALDGVIKREASPAGQTAPGPLAIKVLSPYEIEIEAVFPDPLFPSRLTSPILGIVPKELANLPPGDFGVSTVVGTGPFRVVSRSDTEVALIRNPRHWRQSEGNVERVTYKVIKNDQIRLVELKSGRVDFAFVPSTMADGLIENVNGNIVPRPDWAGFGASAFGTFNVIIMGFNDKKMDAPLRAALSFGIRRADLAKLVPAGLVEAVSGPIPLTIAGYKPPEKGDVYDPEKAKLQLALSQSALHSGPIELLVHERDGSEQLGQLIQSQLKEIGVQIVLKKLDYNAVIGRMMSGDFDSFIIGFEFIYPTAGPIAYMLFSPEKVPVSNFWRYDNPQVTALLEKFKTTASQEESNRLAAEVEKMVIADPPAAFLMQNKMLVVYRNGVSNVHVNGFSAPLLWQIKIKK